MKKQGAAYGREGKPRDAGDRGSQQNGQHGNGAPCQRLRHRASRKQKPDAETSAKDAAHDPNRRMSRAEYCRCERAASASRMPLLGAAAVGDASVVFTAVTRDSVADELGPFTWVEG